MSDYKDGLLDAGLAELHPGITAEKVLEAHRQLEAQIEAAVRVAFNEGMDFVRQIAGTVDPDDDGHTTFAVNAGPWPVDQETPPGCVRYTRPANWPHVDEDYELGPDNRILAAGRVGE